MRSASEASSDDADHGYARSRDRPAKRPRHLFRRHLQRAQRRRGRSRHGGSAVFSSNRRLLDEWLYDELRRQAAPDGVLRLGRNGETLLARLEVRDSALASAIEDRAVTLDRGGAAERRLRRKVVILSSPPWSR